MQLSKEFTSQSREHNMSANTLAIFSLQNLMRNSKNVFLFLAAALLLCTASLNAQEKNAPLENSDVIKLTASHFGDELLLKIIDKSENHFDVSPTALIALKKGGVSDKAIAAMQDAVARKLAPPAPAAPSANPPAIATTAAPAASGANAIAGVTIPQLPTVSLLAGGSTSPMQPSIAQIAKTSAPQGLSAANPLSGGNPLGSLAFDAKARLLEAIDAYARAKDPRVRQVSASLAATWQAVEILRGDGETYRDVRPLVRVNVAVVVGDGERQDHANFSDGHDRSRKRGEKAGIDRVPHD